ncbi:hypothetical protein HK101_012048 [Irineochytrium annulatum]|nr:hypothetical protein HK101_012048 [Irineochytrium annulatum]
MFLAHTDRRRTAQVLLSICGLIILSAQFMLLLPRLHDSTRIDLSSDDAALAYQASLRLESSRFGISFDELDNLLGGAADANRTIILIPFNAAYTGITENLICSIRRLEYKQSTRLPIVYWPLDEGAYRWAKGKGLKSVLYDDSLYSVSKFVGYDHDGKTSPYFRMMRERGKMFRRIVHDLGYNMFFLDADMVLLDNPLKLLKWDSSIEIQMDGWNREMVYMPEVPPTPGPKEVPTTQLTPAEQHAKALRGPALPKPIPYFQPESEWIDPAQVVGCAGAFFLRADDGGRFAAKELERLLAEKDDIDDQQALNVVMAKYAWQRNYSHRNRSIEDIEDHERFLTMRYMPQHRAINGHVFFTFRDDYLRVKAERHLPEPTLIHANGVANKTAAFEGQGLWFLHPRWGCFNIFGIYF